MKEINNIEDIKLEKKDNFNEDIFSNSDEFLFRPLNTHEKVEMESKRVSKSYLQDAWDRFKKDKLAMAGMYILFVIILLAVFGPMVSSHTYDGQDIMNQNMSPSFTHIFGTDKFGRDIFVRTLYGARISLSVGFMAAFINLIIGVIYGGISGYFGGKVDMVLMRIVDIITGIPSLLYIILIMMFLGNSLFSILLALCMTFWIRTARVVRSQILTLKHQEFVLAAKVIGEKPMSILMRHLIPNSMGPIIVTVTFLIPQAIFSEAFLSFLGIGISVPMASWGTLANEAIPYLLSQPYQMFFPAFAISITIFALNFIGDGLRDALDPKLKK